MGFTLIQSGSACSASGVTVLNIAETFDIAEGDLLVGLASWEDGTSVVTMAESGGGNAFTMMDMAVYSSCYSRVGYVIGAAAGSDKTMRLSLATSRGFVNFMVFQYRPDSGDTVSLVSGPLTNSGTGTTEATVTTDSFSVDADDILAVAHCKAYVSYFNVPAAADLTIGGAQADVSEFPLISSSKPEGGAWAEVFSSAQTDIVAQAELTGLDGGSKAWIAEGLVFKAVSAGGTAYSLEAAAGAFTLSGQSVGLLAGRLISAVKGEFTLAGQDVSLLAGRKLAVDPGAFTLSGQAVGLRATRKLSASVGEFALSGQTVDLLRGLLLSAGAGAFVLTGQDVDLTYSAGAAAYTLTAEAGAFALTGQAVGLYRGYLLPAGAGSFALTGQSAGLLRGYLLTADAGAFQLSGQAVSLLRAYLLSAGAGAFTLTGQDAALLRGFLLSAGVGEFALSGQAVSLLKTFLLSAGAGAFLLTGQDVELDWSGEIVASGLATITFTGSKPKITFSGARPKIAFTAAKPKITFSGARPKIAFTAAKPKITFTGEGG